MKAIALDQTGGPEVLKISERPDPVPGPNEVIVRLKAASLNHVDIWVRAGNPAYAIPLPHIPGTDGAGIVEKAGRDVEGVSEGDRVVIFPGLSCGHCELCRKGLDNQCDSFEIFGIKRPGTYAEKVAVPDDNVVIIPDSLSFEEAAAYGVAYGTAWHMVTSRAQLKKGETILVLGAGSGIGSAAIQMGKSLGAHVLALTTDAAKVPAIKKLGADAVYVTKENPNFSEWVRKETAGRGADVVVEHVGPATWDESLKSLARYGRLVTCGATTGPTVTLDLRFLFSRNLSLLGSRMCTKKDFQLLSSLIFSGRLKPLIDQVFPLKQAAAAHARLESHGQMGKIVLKID